VDKPTLFKRTEIEFLTLGTDRQRDRETERQRDRETERKKDGQTDRKTDRKTFFVAIHKWGNKKVEQHNSLCMAPRH
jgi:hypothetical protein